MKYAYEGSNGGYPIMTDEEDLFFDFITTHHDCCICGDKDVSEEDLYRTSMGWMHIECYDSIINLSAEEGGEIPELL